VGGCIGMARANHLAGGPFLLAVLFGLMIGVIALWVVWNVVYRGSFFVLRRTVHTATLPWSKVMPAMFVVLLIFSTAAGYFGSLLAELFIRHILLR
jgi:hypothetical protein